jgi:hypothetical protein
MKVANCSRIDPGFKNLHFKAPVACSRAINLIKSAIKAMTMPETRGKSSGTEADTDNSSDAGNKVFQSVKPPQAHQQTVKRSRSECPSLHETDELGMFLLLVTSVVSVKQDSLEN